MRFAVSPAAVETRHHNLNCVVQSLACLQCMSSRKNGKNVRGRRGWRIDETGNGGDYDSGGREEAHQKEGAGRKGGGIGRGVGSSGEIRTVSTDSNSALPVQFRVAVSFVILHGE